MTRLLLAFLAAMAMAAASPALAQTPSEPQRIEIPASAGRSIPVTLWPAENERGVIIFSHGFNGSPDAYGRIVQLWLDQGFTVVAPLHVDSLRHPAHGAYDNQAAFGARIEDLAVVRGFAKASRPGLPIVAAGHSFGSLMSLIQAGAVTAAGPLGDSDIRGVIAFSSPGDIPGLITPQTYQSLAAPLLMITGDEDLVPGFVTDWTAHRLPFDRSPDGDRTLVVFEGGDHNLVADADEADFALIAALNRAFLEAYAFGDAEALARLAAIQAGTAGAMIERR